MTENPHETGAACCDEVVEDSIGDLFIEGRAVSKAGEVKFERLCFDAVPVGDVFDVQRGKIGLAGDGAQRGEIVRIEFNDVVALRIAVLERLERGMGNA